jgi:hypothetical protein
LCPDCQFRSEPLPSRIKDGLFCNGRNFSVSPCEKVYRTMFHVIALNVFSQGKTRREGDNERMEKYMVFKKDIRKGKQRIKRRAS